MKTIEINLFKFSELSETAQQRAIEKLASINVDHNWWQFVYEDAENIGLKINEFDLDRNRYAKGDFICSASECAEKIILNHGENTQTHKTASNFLQDWKSLVLKYSNELNPEKVSEGNEDIFDSEADELEQEFLNSLLEDYAIILQSECDYLQSKEAIIETIEANDYDFTENGDLY